MTPTSHSKPARVVTRLRSKEDWQELLAGRSDAVHLRSFGSAQECAQLLHFITGHPRTAGYKTAAGILRLGSSFNDVRKSGRLAEEYSKADILEEALTVNVVVARMIGMIAGSWPWGVQTFAYQGLPLHRSIARRILGGSAEPHDANIAKELPSEPGALAVQVQLGVNLYLEVPEVGGELEGWHVRLSREEYDALRNPEPSLHYGIRRDAIGECHWVLKPGLGDVIIFQNSELHAIRGSASERTTWGFFLGYREGDKALLIWS